MPTRWTTADADQVWQRWYQMNSTATSTATAANYIDQVWRGWSNTYTTTTAGSITINGDLQSASIASYTSERTPMRQPTAEEREAAQQRRDQRAEERLLRRQQGWRRDFIQGYLSSPARATQREEFEAIETYEAQRSWSEGFLAELHRQQRREREEAARLAAGAHDRGLELLKLVLTPEEQAKFEQVGQVCITGSEGGEYQISPNSHEGNVYYYEDGKRVAAFCAHPRMYVNSYSSLPDSDAAVAQVLALKSDEFGFLVTANVYNNYGLNNGSARKRLALQTVRERETEAVQARTNEAIEALRLRDREVIAA